MRTPTGNTTSAATTRALTLLMTPLRWSSQTIISTLVLVVLFTLIVPPLFAMGYESIRAVVPVGDDSYFTLEQYRRIFFEGGGFRPAWNSLQFALGGTIISIVLGGFLAWITERTNTPFRSMGYFLAFAVLAMPGILYTVSWIFLLGRSGPFNGLIVAVFGMEQGPLSIHNMYGMIWVEGLNWVPLAFLLIGAAFRLMDPSLEESAAMSGAKPFYTLRRITFPLVAPATLAVFILSFIRSIESFATPAIIGLPAKITVLTTMVYHATLQFPPNYAGAAAYGTLLLTLVAGLIWIYTRATAAGYRYQTVSGKGFRPRPLDLGRLRYLTFGILIVFVIVLGILPLGMLLWLSLQPYATNFGVAAISNISMQNYTAVFGYDKAVNALVNSTLLGISTATVSMVMAMVIAWILTRSRRGPLRSSLDILSTLPIVVPGIVLGIAYLRLYAPLPIPVYGTLLILLLAYVAHGIPYSLRYAHSGMVKISSELEEAAFVSGAKWWMTMRRVVFPLILPALMAGWAFAFLGAVKELSSSIILSKSGTEVVGVALFDLIEDGQLVEFAALGTIVMVIFGIPGIILYSLMNRQGAYAGSG